MKDISQVLRQKEQDLLRVQHEVEALHLTITLLSDENTAGVHSDVVPIPTRNANRWPLEVH